MLQALKQNLLAALGHDNFESIVYYGGNRGKHLQYYNRITAGKPVVLHAHKCVCGKPNLKTIFYGLDQTTGIQLSFGSVCCHKVLQLPARRARCKGTGRACKRVAAGNDVEDPSLRIERCHGCPTGTTFVCDECASYWPQGEFYCDACKPAAEARRAAAERARLEEERRERERLAAERAAAERVRLEEQRRERERLEAERAAAERVRVELAKAAAARAEVAKMTAAIIRKVIRDNSGNCPCCKCESETGRYVPIPCVAGCGAIYTMVCGPMCAARLGDGWSCEKCRPPCARCQRPSTFSVRTLGGSQRVCDACLVRCSECNG